MNLTKPTALGRRTVAVAVMGIVAGCSPSPVVSAPSAGPSQPASAVTAPAPSQAEVAHMAPACAPPEAAVKGGTLLNEWAASAERMNTLAGFLAFNLRGGSVSRVEIVVGTSDAVSDPSELSSTVSAKVLARSEVPGIAAAGSASHAFSIDYTPQQPGRLPVFALTQYITGRACGSITGEAAQPLGWITVN